MRNARRVYLDTNVFIELTEGRDGSRMQIERLVRCAYDVGATFVTSALTFSELLVRPYREGNVELVKTYKMLGRGTDWLHIVLVTDDILDQAAKLRAASAKLKLPDAIHLATASNDGCTAFVTADQGISDSVLRNATAAGLDFLAPLTIIRPDEPTLSAFLESLTA